MNRRPLLVGGTLLAMGLLAPFAFGTFARMDTWDAAHQRAALVTMIVGIVVMLSAFVRPRKPRPTSFTRMEA